MTFRAQFYLCFSYQTQIGYWWLIYQDELVGNWPANIFKEFGEYAAHINIGGKIYNSEPGGIHIHTNGE